MSPSTKPHVLIIDDEPDAVSSSLSLEQEILQVKSLHPGDVVDDDLTSSQLILLDYDLKYWPNRESVDSICLQPLDGLALGSVLRSRLKHIEHSAPVSFAIFTGEFAKLASPLPPENREHALAGLVNMDWIFQKNTDANILLSQIAALANGVQRLPQRWLDDSLTQLGELLGLDFSTSENQQYLSDIEDCLPPIHELFEWSHGIAILRWLLHRVLPYPTFLLDLIYLAARFRVSLSALETNITPGRPLYNALDSYAYKGILGGFLGRRWWRSGIEDFLWQITEGNSGDFGLVRKALTEIAGEELEPSNPPDFPVVCLDENYRELREFCTQEDAVRIQPDYYPNYADQPWISKSLAKADTRMRSLVLRDDLPLID